MSSGNLNLDIRVEECSSCKNLVIRDDSHYLETPENPRIVITLPGYTTALNLPFTQESINIFNSYSLGLSATADTDSLIELPDGIYQLTYAICPYDEFYIERYHMRQCQAWCRFDTYLRELFDSCYDLDTSMRDKLQQVEWLLKGATAYAEACDPNKAVKLHRKALSILDSIQCQLGL